MFIWVYLFQLQKVNIDKCITHLCFIRFQMKYYLRSPVRVNFSLAHNYHKYQCPPSMLRKQASFQGIIFNNLDNQASDLLFFFIMVEEKLFLIVYGGEFSFLKYN